jgi:FkbH-like protein
MENKNTDLINSNSNILSTIIFDQEDLKIFSKLSYDNNPFHMDESYARKSAYGKPVVFGILGVFACLKEINADKLFLDKIDIEFQNPIFLNIEYTVVIIPKSKFILAELRDGKKVLVRIRVFENPQAPQINSQDSRQVTKKQVQKPEAEPLDYPDSDFSLKPEVNGEYPTTEGLNDFKKLKHFPENLMLQQAQLLMACSYLVGMKLPGKRAFFSKLLLNFKNVNPSVPSVSYKVNTQHYDQTYSLLDIDVKFSVLDSLLAHAEIKAIARKELDKIPLAKIKSGLNIPEDFAANKVALVTGGSRGLGATFVRGLALAGYHVIINYYKSKTEAQQLNTELTDAGCSVSLLEGDIGNEEFCKEVVAQIKKDYNKLDLLICNACQPPILIDEEPSTLKRRQDYIAHNLRLFKAPLNHFCPLLEQRKGICIGISSIIVEIDPKGFSHYIQLKKESEALIHEASGTHSGISWSIVRPPKLLTDMGNTPMRSIETFSPEVVALQVINSLVKLKPEEVKLHNAFSDHLVEEVESAKGLDIYSEKIILSASFTIDSIFPALSHWRNSLLLPAEISNTEYQQTFQELLNPESNFNKNEKGMNTILLRMEDWIQKDEKNNNDERFDEAGLEKILADFIQALKAYSQNTYCLTFIVICPSSGLYQQNKKWNAFYDQAEQKLINEVKLIQGVELIKSEAFHGIYNVTDFLDPLRNEMGHIPYTDNYFNFLGTLIARRYNALHQPVYKVIAVDCDNTLWDGVCGELGPTGVKISAEFLQFQQFLANQVKKGVLVCLCSKNQEQDVWDVFEKHPDMVLTRKDIVDAKINWVPKSINLQELASSLNLGLDSFIFIDDNPVECAEVRANAPEVLTFQFEDNFAQSKLFDHIWAFDRYVVTEEDQKKTQMYQADKERSLLEEKTISFADFLKNLKLSIHIQPASHETLPRISQLTQKTNQFNFTTIRRAELDIQQLLDSGEYRCNSIHVTDRFGDYGLVGVIIYKFGEECLEIDTFLLSCRVLGRGVEHKMLQYLSTEAKSKGLKFVETPYFKTAKNEPALRFLKQSKGEEKKQAGEGNFTFKFEVDAIAKLKFQPQKPNSGATTKKAQTTANANTAQTSTLKSKRELEKDLLFVANNSFNISALQNAIQEKTSSDLKPGNLSIDKDHSLSNEDLQYKVTSLFARTLSLEPEEISLEEEIEQYGIDSYSIVNIMVELLRSFPDLPPTFLFEHRTIRSITNYLWKKYFYENELPEETLKTKVSRPLGKKKKPVAHNFSGKSKNEVKDIAIIGINGRYPGSPDINTLWQHLEQGKDCITTIPDDRWEVDRFYDASGDKKDKSYCKSGGFLDNIDKFDAAFFNISPLEAEMMDPQQRIFLESVWGLIEDAGYTRESLDKNTGVYVGVLSNDYNLYESQAALQGSSQYRMADYYQIPNRVSYFLNLQGPSLAVDTACSSSGTALHLACESLKRGECNTAIVGGVNLFLHPTRFIQYSQMQMLTRDTKCKPFSKHADGTLLGEGVGSILIKSLEQAEADGDRIYAVIKSTATNSGGKTNGFTVPSPNAQANLIKTALQKADIDPRTISYIEAHGTGTKLGDPIELRGLSLAFEDANKTDEQRQYCSIASIKSNIGHLESCAAMAGITKIILQMQHKCLVPSLHAEESNPQINFELTPFSILREKKEWKQPIVEINGEKKTYPRRAGISSFGAGGSNAHIILEEYVSPEQEKDQNTNLNYPAVIILSAKNQQRLNDKVIHLSNYLEGLKNIRLHDVAYTLQTGREAMEERLAIIASDIDDLKKQLIKYQQGKRDGFFTGNIKKDKSDFLLEGNAGKFYVEKVIQEGKPKSLAQLWIKNVEIDWNLLYDEDNLPRKISLPTYPFARERHWISSPTINNDSATAAKQIHPLLHCNISSIDGQRFSSVFTGEELFLNDLRLKDEKMFPRGAYLEMAIQAFKQSTRRLFKNGQKIVVNNVVWSRPVPVSHVPTEFNIDIFPLSEESVAFEVFNLVSDKSEEVTIHSQGEVSYSNINEGPDSLNITELQNGLSLIEFDSKGHYKFLSAKGLEYGLSYQGLEKLYLGSNSILAQISLPGGSKDEYLFHPNSLEAILQAYNAFYSQLDEKNSLSGPLLPQALNSLEVLDSCSEKIWVLIRQTKISEDHTHILDIEICDESGKVCIRIHGLTLRLLDESAEAVSESVQNLLFKPSWIEKPLSAAQNEENQVRTEVFFLESDTISDLKDKESLDYKFHYLKSDKKTLSKRFEEYALSLFTKAKEILLSKPKENILLQVVVRANGNQEFLIGLSGLLKTISLENPKVSAQLIYLDQKHKVSDILNYIRENSNAQNDRIIRYENKKRFVQSFHEIIQTNKESQFAWKENGVYLITGGTGGLGQIFAREIAENSKGVTLILTGRSTLNEVKKKQFKVLEDLGVKVLYRSLDVANTDEVEKLIKEIQREYKALNGVLHSAGVIRDNFIIRKDKEEFRQVLSPKVSGVYNLDEATKSLKLDFIALFSSTSGSLGNAGQGDYATANAFMDAFAGYRNKLKEEKKRYGHTVSINWPLWKQGGMSVDEATENIIREHTGMVPMQTSSGIAAFYNSMESEESQVMVIEGYPRMIKAYLNGEIARKKSILPKTDKVEIEPKILHEKTLFEIKSLFGEIIKLAPSKIEAEEPLESYGIDSIMITRLNRELDQIFGGISKTLFFEYQTLDELTKYFVSDYQNACAEWVGIKEQIHDGKTAVSTSVSLGNAKFPELISLQSKKQQKRLAPGIDSNKNNEPIAIIGVSGRYPKARDLEEFWNNLKSGKDCVSVVPEERWSLEDFYHPDKEVAVAQGKSYSKWGGFLEGFNEFDPLFFNISPKEAMNMDPQERLFLQSSWHLLEDAGYTRERIARQHNGKVGVFAGITKSGFELYGPDLWKQGEHMYPHTSFSSVANRVSYLLNLQGPSMPVDTMCSSSLTAIHEACEHLRQNECEMAIAGGVNLYLHPSEYSYLCSLQMLSEDGQCKSFGNGGNGYVPGEGVGVVLLKPLSRAIEDNDQIHGVIRATGVNHGGKTNGYTVPNPKAQGALIRATLEKAGIDARKVSYIEAHGTGTALGDPIEVTGLSQAFEKDTEDKGFCALGSAKSNIGHLEAAAGIAGVTKILLQMKHQTLVPSLHSRELNPNIDFKKTPFVVQQESALWQRPVVKEANGEEKEYPRIAGISSFGAGGSNAHLVIEEYIPEKKEDYQPSSTPAIIVLSA